MNARATALLGFGVAGITLVAIAGAAPRAALAVVGVIGLGVLLGHASDIQALVGTFNLAVQAGKTG